LCHDGISLDTIPQPEIVRRFYISSSARPASATPDIQGQSLEQFLGKNDSRMETDYPLAKAAMVVLGESWPERIAFADLLLRAQMLLKHPPCNERNDLAEEPQCLARILLQTHSTGLVQFHLHTPRFAGAPGPWPVASPLARYQMQHSHILTNLFHDAVMVEGNLAAYLLSLLDGSRDRATLAREMAIFMKSELENSSSGETKVQMHQLETHQLIEHLDRNLNKLAKLGLLVA
jgi:hypothetical protein